MVDRPLHLPIGILDRVEIVQNLRRNLVSLVKDDTGHDGGIDLPLRQIAHHEPHGRTAVAVEAVTLDNALLDDFPHLGSGVVAEWTFARNIMRAPRAGGIRANVCT